MWDLAHYVGTSDFIFLLIKPSVININSPLPNEYVPTTG